MAMASPCAGCKIVTSYIFAAQFSDKDQHLIICNDCWADGVRCYRGPDKLIVGKDLDYKEAVLYWDEGGFVTGGDRPVTYPSNDQP